MRKSAGYILIAIMICQAAAYAQDDWSLRIIGGMLTPGLAQAVANYENYALVADANYGVSIFDLSSPILPCLVGAYNHGGWVNDIVIDGDKAYLAHWSRGMVALDLTNPTEPESLGAFNTIGTAIDVCKIGDLVYVADFTNGLVILDVTDPASITQTGQINQGITISVAAIDSVIYLGVSGIGLLTCTLADTANPVIRDVDSLNNDCNDILINGDHLLLSCGQAGMIIYDISNRLAPDSVTAVNTAGSVNRVAVKDTIAYLADGASGLTAVNITDYANPQMIQTMNTTGNSNGVGFYDDYVLLADNMMILVVYHDEYSDIDSYRSELPTKFEIVNCYPNPFNSTTSINFELEHDAMISLDIYDVRGRLIDNVISEFYRAGSHAINWDADDLPSGMYFAKLKNGSRSSTAKLLYLK